MNREEIIGELQRLKYFFEKHYDKFPTCLEEAIDYIYRTPQPERKKGRWIRIGGSEKCSVCGYIIDDEYYLGNFCQNCGARMEEPE